MWRSNFGIVISIVPKQYDPTIVMAKLMLIFIRRSVSRILSYHQYLSQHTHVYIQRKSQRQNARLPVRFSMCETKTGTSHEFHIRYIGTIWLHNSNLKTISTKGKIAEFSEFPLWKLYSWDPVIGFVPAKINGSI